jgi:hypothetical protein
MADESDAGLIQDTLKHCLGSKNWTYEVSGSES